MAKAVLAVEIAVKIVASTFEFETKNYTNVVNNEKIQKQTGKLAVI